jgi:hypothetical protein
MNDLQYVQVFNPNLKMLLLVYRHASPNFIPMTWQFPKLHTDNDKRLDASVPKYQICHQGKPLGKQLR